MFDHVTIRAADRAASERYYGGFLLDPDGSGVLTEYVHVALPASENSAVDAFHRAATEAGYRGNGPPGERPEYHPGYYGAFVLDPDGNNVELVSHSRG